MRRSCPNRGNYQIRPETETVIFTENQTFAKPLYENMAALLFLLKNSLNYDIIHLKVCRAKLLGKS